MLIKNVIEYYSSVIIDENQFSSAHIILNKTKFETIKTIFTTVDQNCHCW